MMNQIELDAYFARIGLPVRGRRLVEKARRASPVRKVQSRTGNVLTHFPSRKMQKVVVAESRTVEFPAFMRYEHDPDVLEYYPQPVSLDLRTEHPLTKKVSRIQHTPDVLLLRRDCVCIDEWREDARLQKLMAKHPDRFTKHDKQWNCPQVETHLHEYGIQYRLRTADEHPQTFVQNLLFLADYYAPEASRVSDKALVRILDCIDECGEITIADLFELGRSGDLSGPDRSDILKHGTADGFTPDDIYKAIADELVSYDLWHDPLSETHRSRVFRDQSTLEFARRLEAEAVADNPVELEVPRIASIQAGDIISYDGKDYTITLAGAKNVTLAHEGNATEVSVSTLEGLFNKGQISITPQHNTTSTDFARAQVVAFSPKDLARAVERGRVLDLAENDPSVVPVSKRTLRRYKETVRKAGANPVLRNLALVGNVRDRGNRTRKIPEEVLALIERIAAECYNQPNSPNYSSAFRDFVKACHEQCVTPCSYKSFSLEIKKHASIRKRGGKRRAYQATPIVWYLKAKDPIHGIRPFEYVHIDHTPLDIVLISGDSKKLLGRPWLSLAIDAESRAIVGFYLSFAEPSYRSCMMVLRDIVRRYGRLPGTIITDNGPEFRGAAFQNFCDLYKVILRYRPAGQPRHGSVGERIFGTVHSQLIHNLAGNTKQLKDVRTVTKSVAPDRHAEWTLPALYGALDKYFVDIYGTDEHPAHGEAPESHLQARLTETGLRLSRLVKLDRVFLIETCPPPDRKGTRIVDPQRGVKVNHLWYWTDAFRSTRLPEKALPVRVDPWDARVCYVLLNGEWHQCVSKLASQLRRLSRRELQSYYEEMSKRSGVKKRDLTPERIAEWTRVLDKGAFDSRLKDKQAEARLIYDDLKLSTVDPDLSPGDQAGTAVNPPSAPEWPDAEVDEEDMDDDNEEEEYGYY